MRERCFERVEVVELDNSCGDRGIDWRADVSAPGLCRAVRVQGDESLVDGPVIAPVEDEDFGAPGDLAGEANRKPVGIGSGQSKLPVGESKALLQFFRNEDGVFTGKHE